MFTATTFDAVIPRLGGMARRLIHIRPTAPPCPMMGQFGYSGIFLRVEVGYRRPGGAVSLVGGTMRALMMAGAGALALWSGVANASEFLFTGAVQKYIVEADGTYILEAAGAAGGAAGEGIAPGGFGALVGSTAYLSKGAVLTIYVGGMGGDGALLRDNTGAVIGSGGGGGGGGTFVFYKETSSLPFGNVNNALIIAGGGGGEGGSGSSDGTGELGTTGMGGAGVSAGGGAGLRSNGGDANGAEGGSRPADGAAGGRGQPGGATGGAGGAGGFGGGGGGSSARAASMRIGGGGGGGGYDGGDGEGQAGNSFFSSASTPFINTTFSVRDNGRFVIQLAAGTPMPPPISIPPIFTPTPAPATGAVPEPATWAMMICGFGAVGVGMRRRVRASEVKFSNRIKRIATGELA